ncbi:MAG TPA: serine hydrolase domain-containing protein [Candidatus Polarisedimenticolaceae bacterium]|nr:serine hydrolase domain-containing protein [Candidatus Polarisedimenticolaceae bacterium]
MRRPLAAALLCVACLAACSLAPSDPLAAKLDAYLAECTRLGRFSGAVLVQRAGRQLFAGGYGFAQIGTPMPIASISKMFTAMAVLRLRDAGKLALADPLCRWVDDCPAAWQPVTLDHLLHHTSGIPDYEEPLELGSPRYLEFMASPEASRRIVAEARAKPLDFAPGEKFHYSNTGYVLLGSVAERASHLPFAALIRETVLIPAGMASSGVFGGSPPPQRLADGYTYETLPWEKFLPGVELDSGFLRQVPRLPLTSQGDAGLFSTVEDLARWSEQMDGEGEVFQPGLGGYGYGWQIDELFEQRRQRHNGMLPGYVSELWRFPDSRVTIVILCNMDRARLTTIARNLAAIVFDKPYDMPVHGELAPLTPAQFDALVGEYSAPDGTHYTVRKDPEMLVVERQGAFTAGLLPLSPTRFYMPLADGAAEFSLGADARASELNLRYRGEDHRATRR